MQGQKRGEGLKARVGVAGVDTRPLLHLARVGVAGNWSPGMMQQVLREVRALDRKRLGDRVAQEGWKHGVLFLDYTYTVVPNGSRSVRWRPVYAGGWGPEERPINLFYDCGSYRIWTGKSPRWNTRERYCQAIAFARPDGYMSFDVYGDAQRSFDNYQWMLAQGYEPYPVYHFHHLWDPRAEVPLHRSWGRVSDAEGVAIANARRVLKDPILRYMANRSSIVAIGGMVQGPVPREARGAFLAEVQRNLGVQLWALGQASGPVLNRLARYGVLDDIWTDGTTWLHHARTGQFYVVADGELKNVKLTGSAMSLFTLSEMAAANIRALLGYYGRMWTWPEPAPLPDFSDPDGLEELHRRIEPVQATLLPLLPRTFGQAQETGDVEEAAS